MKALEMSLCDKFDKMPKLVDDMIIYIKNSGINRRIWKPIHSSNFLYSRQSIKSSVLLYKKLLRKYNRKYDVIYKTNQ